MPIKLSSALKEAIINMPTKEKDKLLLRYIAKDAAMVERLTFLLLEGGETTEERRDELQEAIQVWLRQVKKDFYSPGHLLLNLREISGKINWHVKATRDKYGEIALNFYMLNEMFNQLGDRLPRFSYRKSRTLSKYVLDRSLKLLKLMSNLHEDYQLDFLDDMKTLGAHIASQPHMLEMIEGHSLELDWLMKGIFPESF
jgi:hypothetical protein